MGDYKKDIDELIDIYIEENDLEYLTKDDYDELVEYAHISLQEHNDIKINKQQIISIMNNLLEGEMIYYKKPIVEKTPEDEEYDRLEEYYEYLMNLPQPEQKSKAWFDMRNNMITASSAFQAIDYEKKGKYGTMEDYIYEKLFGRVFSENKMVHHGKKYEHIITMYYEHIYNAKIGEFGLLQHPQYSFIGASPDGICSSYRLDGTRGSPLLGTMLEIKCPYSRPINTSGEIINGICPDYYYMQVQLQLQCCNLKRCDFIQATIREYTCEDEFLNDNYIPNHTENQNEPLKINPNFGRNAVIQLLPKKWVQKEKYDSKIFYSKYLYPPSLNMDRDQILEWIQSEKEKFPSSPLATDYKFDQPLFFRVVSSHNISIYRDDKYFADALPKLKKTWDTILHYKANKEEAQKFKDAYDSKKKPKVEFTVSKPNSGFIDTE